MRSEEKGDQPFILRDSILEEFPELAYLSGHKGDQIPRAIYLVSSSYANLGAVDKSLSDIERGGGGIGIDHHLEMVEKSLGELSAEEPCQRFVRTLRERLKETSARAKRIIGNRKRAYCGRYI